MVKGIKLGLIFMLLIVLSSFASALTLDGNFAFYNMSNSGTTVIDYYKVHNGTASGVSFGSDATSKYAQFSSADYILLNNINQAYDEVTFAGWINQVNNEAENRIAGFYTSGSSTMALKYYDQSDLLAYFVNDEVSLTPTVGDLSGSWYFVTVTYTKDGDAVLYLDGSQVAIDSTGNTKQVTISTDFRIGNVDGTISSFNGNIAGFSLWNRSLTGTEVGELYNLTRGFSPELYIPPINNFTISARDSTTLANIQTFNATVNGTYYNTTIGLITLPYLLSEAQILNITVKAENYDTGTYNNYNISNPLVADLNISLIDIEIIGREVITNQTVSNFTINSTFYNTATNNGTINIGLPKDSNIFNITNPLGYHNKTNFEFNVSQMKYTYYVYFNNIKLNITAKDLVTNTSISNFTINLLYLDNGTLDESNLTLTGNIYYNNLINGLYNATIDAEGFELQTVQLNLTSLNEAYEFELFTTNSINITFRDELTNNIITDNIIVEFISDTQSYNYSTTSGYLYVDLLAPESYNIRYSSANYTTRYYYFVLSNRTYNELNLYLLEDTSSDLITVTVIDQEANSLESALVKSLKYDVLTNSYILQQSIKTDSNGQAVFSARIGEEFYYFIVEYPAGTQLKQTTPALIYSSTVLIQVQTQPSGGTSWGNTLGVNYNITWYNDTNEFTFRYNDLEGTVSEGCFYIYDSKYNGKTLLNSTCSNGASNTLTLGVEGTEGSYYVAKAYVKINGYYTLLDELQIVIPLSSVFNYTSLFFVAILLLAFALTAINTGPAGVVLLPMVGLMGVKLMGLLSEYITWGVVFGLSIIAIIIAVLLKRRIS